MADKDADSTVGPRVAAYDDLGIWHDPGNGQFARPGWSTAKGVALGLFDLIENLAKERGDEGLMVHPKGENLKSLGVASGDTVRARWLDSKHAEVEIVRDGRLLKHKVAWDALDLPADITGPGADGAQTVGFAERLAARADNSNPNLDAGLLRETEALFNHDLGDGYASKAEVVRFTAKGDLSINGVITAADGTAVGTFTRGITGDAKYIGGVEVGHGTLRIDPKHQGQGIGSRFFAASINAYREAGIDRVSVSAMSGDGYNGAYTWAKAGFDWDPRSDQADRLREIADRMLSIDRDSAMARKLRTWEEDHSIPDDYPTPLDIALDPVGAEVLKTKNVWFQGLLNLSEQARTPEPAPADTPKVDPDAERLATFGPTIEQLGIANWETTKPWEANADDTNKPGWLVQRRVYGPDDTAHASSAYRGGRPVVAVSDAYWAQDPEQRRATLYHEAGHTLDRLIGPAEQQTAYDNLLRGPNFAPSKDNPGEMIAEGYALLHTDPQWLADNQPDLLPWLIEQADRVGMPVPDEARNVTPRDFQFRNGDKVDDVLRIPEGVRFEDRAGNAYVRTPGGARSERTGQDVSLGYLSGTETAGGAPIVSPVRPEYTISEDVPAAPTAPAEPAESLLGDILRAPRDDLDSFPPGTAEQARALFEHDLGDGLRSEVHSSNNIGIGKIYVGGKLMLATADGDVQVGEFVRALSRDGDVGNSLATVDHYSIKVSPEYQGKGYASRFLAASLDAYREAGIDRVDVNAVTSPQAAEGPMNGAYTWAKSGFDWSFQWPRAIKGDTTRIGRAMLELDPDSEIGKRLFAYSPYGADNEGVPTPLEVALDPIGKRVLLGEAAVDNDGIVKWQGSLHLTERSGTNRPHAGLPTPNAPDLAAPPIPDAKRVARELSDRMEMVAVGGSYPAIEALIADADRVDGPLYKGSDNHTFDRMVADGVVTFNTPVSVSSELAGAEMFIDSEPRPLSNEEYLRWANGELPVRRDGYDTNAKPIMFEIVGAKAVDATATIESLHATGDWDIRTDSFSPTATSDGLADDLGWKAAAQTNEWIAGAGDYKVAGVEERDGYRFVRLEAVDAAAGGGDGPYSPELAAVVDMLNGDDPIEDEEERVAALGMALFSHDLGDGIEAQFTEGMLTNDGDIVLEGSIVKDFDDIGGFIRRVSVDDEGNVEVYNDYIRINPDHQGQGIGARFTVATLDAYTAAGVDTVRATAATGKVRDINGNEVSAMNGGYTWAKAGFDWDPHIGYHDGQNIGQRMLTLDPNSKIGAALAQWEDGAPTAGMPTPLEVALDPIGKRVLMGEGSGDPEASVAWMAYRALSERARGLEGLGASTQVDTPDPAPSDLPPIAAVRERVRQQSLFAEDFGFTATATPTLFDATAPQPQGPLVVAGLDGLADALSRVRVTETKSRFSNSVGYTADMDPGDVAEVQRYVGRLFDHGGPYASSQTVKVAPTALADGRPGFVVDGVLVGEDGETTIGRWQRQIAADIGPSGAVWAVRGTDLRVEPDQRGLGYGLWFEARTESALRDAGFDHVIADAVSDPERDLNGAYTMAVAGFDWDTSPDGIAAVQALGELLLEEDEDSWIGEALYGWTGEITGDFPTPLDVVMDPDGYEILRHSKASWIGKRSLNGNRTDLPPVDDPDPAAIADANTIDLLGYNAPFRAFPQPVQDRITADAATWFNHDLGDGYRSEIGTVTFSRNSAAATPVTFDGFVFDADNNPVGRFTRTLRRVDSTDLSEPTSDGDTVVIDHEYVALDSGAQGNGLGSRFLAAALEAYRGHGIDTVTTQATSDSEMNGAYTWAVAGFDWDPAHWDSVQSIGERILGIDPDSEIGKALAAAEFTDDAPTPLDVAMDPVGKLVLTGKTGPVSWEGLRRIDGDMREPVTGPGRERAGLTLSEPVTADAAGETLRSALSGAANLTQPEVDRVADALFAHNLPDGFRSEVTGASFNSKNGARWVDVAGRIVSPDGTQVGKFERQIEDRDGQTVVENLAIAINEDQRGNGLGASFTASTFDAFREAGIDRVELVALSTRNGNANGAYTWAVAGFDWDPTGRARMVHHIGEQMLALDSDSAIGRSLTNYDPENIGEDFPTPLDVAMDPVGKQVLLGNHPDGSTSWSGRFDLQRTPREPVTNPGRERAGLDTVEPPTPNIPNTDVDADGLTPFDPNEPIPLTLRVRERLMTLGNAGTGNPQVKAEATAIANAVFTHDLGDGYQSRVVEADSLGSEQGQGIVGVTGEILGPDGSVVGEFTRQFRPTVFGRNDDGADRTPVEVWETPPQVSPVDGMELGETKSFAVADLPEQLMPGATVTMTSTRGSVIEGVVAPNGTSIRFTGSNSLNQVPVADLGDWAVAEPGASLLRGRWSGDGIVTVSLPDAIPDVKRTTWTVTPNPDVGLGVYNDIIKVLPDHQGNGIGSRFIAASEDAYREIGVDQAIVHAVTKEDTDPDANFNGAYTWAKGGGYDWVSTADGVEAVRSLGKKMLRTDPDSEMGQRLATWDGRDRDGIPIPLEVALDPVGAEVLKSGEYVEWWGTKPLSDRFKALQRDQRDRSLTEPASPLAPIIPNDDTAAAPDVPFDPTQPIPLTARVKARLAHLSENGTEGREKDPELLAIARAVFDQEDIGGGVRSRVTGTYNLRGEGGALDVNGVLLDETGAKIGEFQRRFRPMAAGAISSKRDLSEWVDVPVAQESPIPGVAMGDVGQVALTDLPDTTWPAGVTLTWQRTNSPYASENGLITAESDGFGKLKVTRGPNEIEDRDQYQGSFTMSELRGLDRARFGVPDQVDVEIPAEFPPVPTFQPRFEQLPNQGYGVQNYLLELDPAFQGQGIGSRFIAASETSFAQVGFDQVLTHAVSGDGYNGSYTWAKAGGYDWVYPPSDLGTAMLRLDPDSAMGKLLEGYNEGDDWSTLPTPLEVALDPVGKKALAEVEWWGTKPLSDEFKAIAAARRTAPPAPVNPPDDPPINHGRWSVGEMVDADEITLLPAGTEFSTDLDRYIALGGDTFDNEGTNITGERLRQQLAGDQVYIEALPANAVAEPTIPDAPPDDVPGGGPNVPPEPPPVTGERRLPGWYLRRLGNDITVAGPDGEPYTGRVYSVNPADGTVEIESDTDYRVFNVATTTVVGSEGVEPWADGGMVAWYRNKEYTISTNGTVTKRGQFDEVARTTADRVRNQAIADAADAFSGNPSTTPEPAAPIAVPDPPTATPAERLDALWQHHNALKAAEAANLVDYQPDRLDTTVPLVNRSHLVVDQLVRDLSAASGDGWATTVSGRMDTYKTGDITFSGDFKDPDHPRRVRKGDYKATIRTDGTMYIDHVDVTARNQGNHIGTDFVRQLVANAREAGIKRVTFTGTEYDDMYGVTAWAKLGFEIDGGVHDNPSFNRGEAQSIADALGKPLDQITSADVRANPELFKGKSLYATMSLDLATQDLLPAREATDVPDVDVPDTPEVDKIRTLIGQRPAVVFQNGYRDGAVIALPRDLPAGAGREYTITTAAGRQFRMIGADVRGLKYRPIGSANIEGDWISLPDEGPFTVSDIAARPGDSVADGADTVVTSLKNRLLATPEGQAMAAVLWADDLSPVEWFSDEVMERLSRSERFGDIPDGTTEALKELQSQTLRAVRRTGDGLHRRDTLPQKFYRVESADIGQYGKVDPTRNVVLWSTDPPTPDAVGYRLTSGQMERVLKDADGNPVFAWTSDVVGVPEYDAPDVPPPSTEQARADVGTKFATGLAPLDANMWERDRPGDSPRAALIDAIVNGGYAEPRDPLWQRPGTPVQSVVIDGDGNATWTPDHPGTGDAVPREGEVVFSIDDPALPGALMGATQHRHAGDMSQVLATLQNGGNNGRQVGSVAGDYGAWLTGRSRDMRDEHFVGETTKVEYDGATGSFTPSPTGQYSIDAATAARGFVDTNADGKPRLWLPPEVRADIVGLTVDYTKVRDKSLPYEERVAALAEQRTALQRLLPGTSPQSWFGATTVGDMVVKSIIDGTADADTMERVRRVELIQEFGMEITALVAEQRAQALLDNHHVSDEVNAAVIDAGTAGVFGRQFREEAARLEGSTGGSGHRAFLDFVAQLDGNPGDGPLFRLSNVDMEPQDNPGALTSNYGFTLTRPGTRESIILTIEPNKYDPENADMRIRAVGSTGLLYSVGPITMTPGNGRIEDVTRLYDTLKAHADVSPPTDEIAATVAANRGRTPTRTARTGPVEAFAPEHTEEAFRGLLANTPIDRFGLYNFEQYDDGTPLIHGDKVQMTAVRTGSKDGRKHVKFVFATQPGAYYERQFTVTIDDDGTMILNRKGTRRVVGRAYGDRAAYDAMLALAQKLKPHAPAGGDKPGRKKDDRARVDTAKVVESGPMAAFHRIMGDLGVDMSTDESVRVGNGGQGALKPISEANANLAETARAGLAVYPRSWTTALSKDRPIRLQLRTGNVDFRSEGGFNQAATHAGMPDLISTPDISLRPDYADVAGHEFGHSFQHIMPGLLAAEQWHLMTRLAANPERSQPKVYGRARRGRTDYIYEDEFARSYSGRTYNGGIAEAREVFTTAVQGLYKDNAFGTDPKLQGWAAGLMALIDPSGGSAAISGGTTASEIDRANMTVEQLLGGSFNAEDVRNLLKAGDLTDTQRASLRRILDNLT